MDNDLRYWHTHPPTTDQPATSDSIFSLFTVFPFSFQYIFVISFGKLIFDLTVPDTSTPTTCNFKRTTHELKGNDHGKEGINIFKSEPSLVAHSMRFNATRSHQRPLTHSLPGHPPGNARSSFTKSSDTNSDWMQRPMLLLLTYQTPIHESLTLTTRTFTRLPKYLIGGRVTLWWWTWSSRTNLHTPKFDVS